MWHLVRMAAVGAALVFPAGAATAATLNPGDTLVVEYAFDSTNTADALLLVGFTSGPAAGSCSFPCAVGNIYAANSAGYWIEGDSFGTSGYNGIGVNLWGVSANDDIAAAYGIVSVLQGSWDATAFVLYDPGFGPINTDGTCSGCEQVAATLIVDPSVLPEQYPYPTPLPAALPLFAAGLTSLGLLGWRRKRKAAARVNLTQGKPLLASARRIHVSLLLSDRMRPRGVQCFPSLSGQSV